MVEFVKAYYEHNETIMDRNIPKLRDIDSTLAAFLVFFKKKYLQSLPIDTVVDTRFIIKHIQDLYKRKGSEESLRLLFRMFYDEDIEVFYPSTAILKPSDSIWGGARYLELKPVNSVDSYPIQRGDKLTGDVSGASAFVDEIIFVNFSGALTPVVYLSNLTGVFIADDGIAVSRLGTTTNYGKLVSGSISDVNVNKGERTAGQQVGDIVKLVSSKSGTSATGTVATISTTTTGKIDFELEDGGFGYSVINDSSQTSQNDTLISNQVVIVSGTKVDAIKTGDHILAESVVATFIEDGSVGTTVIVGGGRVVAYNHPLLYLKTEDQTRDEFLLYVKNQLSLASIGDSTVNSKMLSIFNRDTEGLSTNYRLGDISNSGYNFVTNRYINAEDAALFESYRTGGSLTTAQTNWIEDRLLPAIYAAGFGHKFNALGQGETVNIEVGVTASVPVTTISVYNASATFDVTTIDNQESVSVITDFIGDFADKPLAVIINATAMQNPGIYEIETVGSTNFTNFGAADNNIGTRFIATGPATGSGTVTDVVATNYGMSGTLVSQGFNAETLNTRIKDAFESKAITIGSISGINITNSGFNFVNDVFSEIEYIDVARFDKRDTILTFANPDFLLEVGDTVSQSVQIEDPSFETDSTVNYTAKGRFLKREGNDFYFRQLSFYDFDENYQINIKNNLYTLTNVRPDSNSLPMGKNAVISGDASYEQGQIDTINVTNTGYRYGDQEIVDVQNSSGQTVATATLRTLGPGTTEGKWSSSTSFLSDSTKALHDNDYYQEYSYDISTIIDPAKYDTLIKDTVGVAGTKVFGSPLINTTSNLDSTLDVEFQVWNLADQPYVTENGNEAIMNLTGNGSDFFSREVTSTGVRIVAAGSVGGQTAVPDAFIEKVARMFELFLDDSAEGINETAHRNVVKTLRGEEGTYHYDLGPTLQRVARGAGSDYTPNFLTDSGIAHYNLSPLFNSHVSNDMVWYLNSTGGSPGDGDNDAQEVIEHVFHTLHMHGLDAVSLKLYPSISTDWQTGPLYKAMEEAYDGGFWDPSGYGGNAFKTNGDAFELAAKEYLFLLNFCMFDYSSLWDGASLSPEWADSVKTPAGIQANLSLGYTLYNTYIGPVISKPSLATIRSIFQDGDVGDPTIAGASGWVVDGNEGVMTEGGSSEALHTEIVSLDQTATNAVTTSIGT